MTIENVDYTTKIPNNVNLADDRQVLRALESWHPGYIDWWMDMGPKAFSRPSFTCAPQCRSIRKAGPNSITYACPTIAGASCWHRRRKAAKSRLAAITASRPGRM